MDKEVRQFYEGLAQFGVVMMKLKPGTKRTTRTWDFFENLHAQRGESRLDLAEEWLKRGFGVGYLLRGRLGAVDADSPDTVQRIHDFEIGEIYIHFPKVHTPSGGIHALLVHPPNIDPDRIKNHVCHPEEDGVKVPWDFKLGERTMLVAPGTVMPKGVYEPGIWLPPPVLDVRCLAPELEIYKSLPPFIRDTRPIEDRIMGAMTYLRVKAAVSIKGQRSRSTLWTVGIHVVAYFDLDPSLAFYLMTENKGGHIAWNNRCLGEDGKLRPWDFGELMDVLDQAVDLAPAYGIYLYKREQERAFAHQGAMTFLEALTYLPKAEGTLWVDVDDLFQAFLDFSGAKPEVYSSREFGCRVSEAINSGQLPFVYRDRNNIAGRILRGMDLNTLKVAIAIYEQRQHRYSYAS